MYRHLVAPVLLGSVLLLACGSNGDGSAAETAATCSTSADDQAVPSQLGDHTLAIPPEVESGEGAEAATTSPTSAIDPALSVIVLPPSLVLDGVAPAPLVMLVTNPASAVITDVNIAVYPPDGATWQPDAGEAMEAVSISGDPPLAVSGTLSGRVPEGGVTSVVVTGTAGGRTLLGSATLAHPPAGALAATTISGGNQLTNDKDLTLSIRVDNTTAHNMGIEATMPATSLGDQVMVASIECPTMPIPPRRSAFIDIVLDGNELPSSDREVRIELAASVGEATDYRVLTHRFTTRAFSDDSLFSLLGVASLLLLPGLAALTGWFVLRSRHRRRRRVISPPLPDLRDLAHLAAIVVLSAIAIEIYNRIAGRSLYDGYGITTLLVVTIGAAVVAMAARLLWSSAVDRLYPVLDSSSDARTVLGALRHWNLPTTRHGDHDYLVLWYHDGAACLVPPVRVASSHVQSEADSRDLDGLRTKALADDEAEIVFEPPGTTLRPVTIAVPATFAAVESAEAVVHE